VSTSQDQLFDKEEFVAKKKSYPDGKPKDYWTLQQVRDYCREMAIEGKRFDCPMCKQTVKIYKRPLNASMAFVLITLARLSKEDEWIHLPTFIKTHGMSPTLYGDTTKLAHWGLLEHKVDPALVDGNPNAGYWRVTAKGRQFVRGEIKVQKYIKIYNKRVLGFSKEETTIQQALKNKHDYHRLMRG
jgi:hypothetical protein